MEVKDIRMDLINVSSLNTRKDLGAGTEDHQRKRLDKMSKSSLIFVVSLVFGLIYQTTIVVAAPQIIVIPDCGSPGDSITISSSGFDAFETLVIMFDSIFLRGLTTNSTGGFIDVNTVPSVADGVYIINVSSTISNTFVVTSFSVPCVADSDGDTFPDNVDNCPFVPNDQSDSDQVCTEEFGIPVCVNFPDGVGDACDNCVDDVNADQSDVDSDGVGDVCDNCPLDANPSQADTDGDDFADACDVCPNDSFNDADSDGLCHLSDNCPFVANPGQEDCDLDGAGDACDLDSPCSTDFDSDGIFDAFDNCPGNFNANQSDVDSDGIGDICDNCVNVSNSNQADNDGDGIGNACDNCIFQDNFNQTDINLDGVGDACDCFDVLQGPFETGIDTGGLCPAAIACTWCESTVTPIRIRGAPNSGQIDVVFVPHTSFSGNLAGFNTAVINVIRNLYFIMDQMIGTNASGTPIGSLPSNYKDRFNFYTYTGGFTTGFSGLYACAGNLPSGFNSDAPFADSKGTLVAPTFGFQGCSLFGPPSKWAATTIGGLPLHETMHSIFSLVDEYCGQTSYRQISTNPNVWRNLNQCQNDVTAAGFTQGNCRQITATGCSKSWWRYDTDTPNFDLMTACTGGGSTCTPSPFYAIWEADLRRINYVFNNWPTGSSKGILVELNINGSKMQELNSEVVSSHPDLGLQEEDFKAELAAADEMILSKFGIADPRQNFLQENHAEQEIPEFSDGINFTLIFPWKGNLRKVSIYNATSDELILTVDLANPLTEFCRSIAYDDPDCVVLDLDNDGIPDSLDICPLSIQPSSGLVSWWTGDENALDIAGNNNGTMVGAVSFASGKVGSAFDFNGNSSVLVLNKEDLNPASISIDAWILPRALSPSNTINVIVAKPNSFDLSLFNLSGSGVIIWRGAGSASFFVLSDPIQLNTFTHVAGTYNASTGEARLYVNGNFTQALIAPAAINKASNNLTIGASFIRGVISQAFNGLIDEVELYNRSLNQNDVRNIFNAGSHGKCKLRDSDKDFIPDNLDNCPFASNQDQSNIDSQNGGDVCDICPADPKDTCNINKTTSASIGYSGGVIESPDGSVEITIPATALTTDTSISVTESGKLFQLTTDSGNAFAIFGVEISPSGTNFSIPISIVFAWPDEDNNSLVDGTKILEGDLVVTKNSRSITNQCRIEANCNTVLNAFTFNVTSLSVFALAGPLDSDGDGIPDNFGGVIDSCPLENPSDLDANSDGCKDTISTLINTTQSFNLQQGISNSLDTKLQNAKDALDAANTGQRQDAVNKLEAFKNEVEAQRHKALTNEQANILIAIANNVIAQI